MDILVWILALTPTTLLAITVTVFLLDRYKS
jgi:hypothetical protein